MLTVKQAITEAQKFFEELFENEYSKLALEEVEFQEKPPAWLITLGFEPHADNTAPSFVPYNEERKYKVFHVDAKTGKVISMKMRIV